MVIVIHLPDPLLPAIAPVERRVRKALARGCHRRLGTGLKPGLAGRRTSLKKRFPTWFTAMNSSKPALPTLIPAGGAETESRVTGHPWWYTHPGWPRRVEMWNVVPIRDVLLHPRQVGANP